MRGEFEGDFLWERNEKKIVACVCVCVAKKGAIGGKCVDYELVESASCREFTGDVARL